LVFPDVSIGFNDDDQLEVRTRRRQRTTRRFRPRVVTS